MTREEFEAQYGTDPEDMFGKDWRKVLFDWENGIHEEGTVEPLFAQDIEKKKAWSKKRREMCGCSACEYVDMLEEDAEANKALPSALAVIIPALLAILFLCLLGIRSCHASEQYDEFKIRAVNSIIGEAESEGLAGMRAIASCLRNRAQVMKKPFKGVYGERSKRVLEHRYSSKTFVLAVRAFEESAAKDYSNGATGWGNAKDVQEFARHKWWKKCVIVARVGNHIFYREKR